MNNPESIVNRVAEAIHQADSGRPINWATDDIFEYTKTHYRDLAKAALRCVLEEIEPVREALERGLKKMRMGYISDDEMKRLEQALTILTNLRAEIG